MSPRRAVVLVTSLCALGAVAPASAGAAPPAWQRIGAGGMNVSDQVGLARTADGALHVAWRRQAAAAAQDLVHTTVAASGRVGSTVPVVTGWASVGSPALVADGSAVTAVFPGTETLVTGDPRFGLDRARSTDGGATWAVDPTAVAQSQFAGSSTPAAVLTPGGLLTSWSAPEGTVVHAGVDPAVPAVGGFGPGVDQGLAATFDGGAMVGWCDSGVSLAAVDPATGARAGDVLALPGTGRCPADTRVAMSAHKAKRTPEESTVFVAASSADGRRVLVFGIDRRDLRDEGFPSPSTGTSFKQQIALAAAPELAPSRGGGLWVAWRDSDTDRLVFRRVRHGGVWGAAVEVPLPAGQRLYQLQLDAQDDRVDVIARTADDDNVVGLYATQVQPGLTLEAPPTARAVKRRGFRVLDAQDGVRGATVRVAGRRLTTSGSGYAKADLAAGTYTVTATKAGYVEASKRVRLR